MDWLPARGHPLKFSAFSVHAEKELDGELLVSIKEGGSTEEEKEDTNLYANAMQSNSQPDQSENLYQNVNGNVQDTENVYMNVNDTMKVGKVFFQCLTIDLE